MFYLITKERLLAFYNSNKITSKGIFNWFIDSSKVLNVLVNIDGVKYLYKSRVEDVDATISMMLTSDMEILGTYDYEETEGINETEIKPSHREEEFI